MPKRTLSLTQFPWDGGIDTTRDQGVLDPNKLTVGNNCVLDVDGNRKTRGGIVHWDTIVIPTHRASSGTTRTITVASTSDLANDDIVTLRHTDAVNSYYDGTAKITVVDGTTFTYTAVGSLTETTTAVSTMVVGLNSTKSIIGSYDFWKETSGTYSQLSMSVMGGATATFFSYDANGARSAIATDVSNYTAVTNATKVTFEVVTNKLIIAFDGTGNTPKYWDGTNPIADLSSLVGVGDPAPPDFSICREHLGRLFTNDKANPNRLNYSETGNLAKWGGAGDSGAMDIAVGDGDPKGITGIFPSHQGTLYVAKLESLHRIEGYAPEEFLRVPVSYGIGCVSHNSISSVDQQDIVWTSSRGFHFLSKVAQGMLAPEDYLSYDIQRDFNRFPAARLPYIQSAYVPSINSVVFAASTNGNDTANSDLYLFNLTKRQWYMWPRVKCQSLMLRTESNVERLYIGTDNGRLLQTQTSYFYDFGVSGASVDTAVNAGSPVMDATKAPIALRLRSGTIYGDGKPYTEKGWKKLMMYYRPRGAYSFTARVTIDNYPPQTLTFSQTGSFSPLGTLFRLGTSVLGAQPVLSPYTLSIDGYGKGCIIDVEHSSADQDLTVSGYGLEFEPAGSQQETIIDP